MTVGFVLVVIVLIALMTVGMSIGYIVKGQCLRGSCGGPEVFGPDGTSLSCETCPLKKLRDEAEGKGNRDETRGGD